ncbi:MAG TPA: hypothetical protein PLK90_04325 [Clostridiales bacterium]|nr:hypothetical protein [Clostridiales bacterium]HQP69608.1 hypothetical protein [Clostridiales bacterium]
MKKTFRFLCLITIINLFFSCGEKYVVRDDTARTLIATVVSQNACLVGEFDEGSKIVDKNISQEIITWEGFKLTLRTDPGETYDYISKDIFYKGDRVLIRVLNGQVTSVKFGP